MIGNFGIRGEVSMAKMNCKCGYILSTTQVPNDIQLRVYTDKEWENIMDCETITTWEIPFPRYDVWRCPKCQRIYVFEDGKDEPVMRYILEK